MTDAEEQAGLARILHALGVILHYADDARLRDTTVKIFVNYARSDTGLLDVFKTNLDVMKMDGLVSWWFAGQIAPSAEWDAEIFLLVLEPKCAWKPQLGQYQALMPRNPEVERWPKRPAAFNHVDAALREMIAGILAKRTARPR